MTRPREADADEGWRPIAVIAGGVLIALSLPWWATFGLGVACIGVAIWGGR